MTPYEILRIPEQASPEEIRAAYEELMERYSSDRYLYSGMAELAESKRREIQTAYESLTGQNPTVGGVSPSAAPSDQTLPESPAFSLETEANNPETTPSLREEKSPIPGPAFPAANAVTGRPWTSASDPDPAAGNLPKDSADQRKAYSEILTLIKEKRFFMARQRFDALPPDENDAEWNHLAGLLAYHDGWLDNARQRLSDAVDLEPSNPEYQKDLKLLEQKKIVKKKAAHRANCCPDYSCDCAEDETFCCECCCGCCGEMACDACCEAACEGC